MPITVSDQGKDFTPAPAGTHRAICVDVIDNGMVMTQWGEKRKLTVRWQIDEPMENGKRFLCQKRYTASLNEKANLRHDLEAWRGRPFTDDELKGFDVETVIGANCLINIVHSKGTDGKTWANVKSVMPLARGMEKLAIDADYVRQKDRKVDVSDEADPEPPYEDGTVDPPYVDDIPFAWVLPMLLPLAGLMGQIA